ncbi:imidazolonepropionase-like amidohydrolase [Amycolatopsis bartoniae]|uniref:Amidohydrolase n=1 Tax=Amycolatopsis bartoniae TaxID=941986 RepID=A0A8H9IT26_9PSEU|nr:amidohydrolase [Amycolatopsis bartoniae]MBB2934910.1 imidazolonepropionase-like amidohydrolase [Amycolatopsis bartoniae]TVS99545.1 amidohydrolase [Amycolatopsis bartoniae]GHF43902.1 amidohydrolase [Amycolatopsis bartoniae]
MVSAIVGGYVVPVDGAPIDGGTVLIEDGRIVAVGPDADVDIPEDAELIDAAGSWVLPGFFDAHVHLGVHEEGEGWSGNDTNEMTDPNGARFRAVDGIDPFDIGFDDALSGGVTSVVVKPGSGNPIGGRTIGVKTWGRTILDMVFAEHVSVKSALGENPKRIYGDKKQTPSTRLGVAAIIREAFTKAQNYAAQRDHARDEGKPFDTDLTMETLAEVLDGDLYWDQHTHRADDIVTAIRLAEEFGYKLVVNHGTEGHLIADVLAEKEVPVILGPLFTTRSKVELRNRSLRAAGILARAGVKLAITTDHPVVPINFLVYQAALAVKDGLDPDAALRALTVNPASMLGLDDRIGSLKPGLDADVVIWSGDPLDVMNRALRVFVRGREVYHFDEAKGEGVVKERRYRE